MSSLEARVEMLEATEQIRRLKLQYATHCDDHYNPEALAALFTEDGVWDGGEHGIVRGREAIREFWTEMSKNATFAIHYITNHIVDVEASGETAVGTCFLWEPITLGGEAMWASVRYSERYRKVAGQWLFEEMKLDEVFCTPYGEGWEHNRFANR